MIAPGLTSVTFRNKSPQEVIDLASKAGLKGIEWGGDIHVPVGEIDNAVEVGCLTRDSGLQVSAYGSYYKVGKSREEGIRFVDVLKTAEALKAPMIRIWAGEKGSKESSQEFHQKVQDETREIADEAGKRGVRLAFEFHENTLNDTYEACCELLTKVAHPEVKTYWQPIHGAGSERNGAGIDMIRQWIEGVHIFHWWPNADVRLPLQQGAEDWEKYFNNLSNIPGTIFGSLEFVKDNSSEQFFNDADTLLKLTGYQQNLSSRKISNETKIGDLSS